MGDWPYLKTAPFFVRHVLAAHYVRDCAHVVEIGGYETPITDFLTHGFEKAVSVDPLIVEREEGRVRHAREDYRDFDFRPYGKEFGLVILGMDLPLDIKLLELVQMAKRCVLEFPPEHLPSKCLFEALMKNLPLRAELQVDFDLGEHLRFGKRRLVVVSK